MRCFCVTLLLGLVAFSAFGQKPTPKPVRPKPAPTPVKKLNEQAEWDKAVALTDAPARIAAFKKFLKNFPKSTHLGEATTQLVTTEYSYANDKLIAGEVDDAADLFTAAVGDAPKPIPDQMWSDQLSKIAANLYFRGARGEALDITKLLEAKTDTSATQLLDIATFYLSIENGTEAKRVAESVLKLDANSAAAYQTLGLAQRMDFDLDDSAAAFTKALELQPDSLTAMRGLAEMKRAFGNGSEAAALYRQILAKDETNLPARTGLILSLFDSDKRSDAEAEMAKSLDANPGNVILLASAAYWYAAHGEAEKAVNFAQKAIETDPRFVWSHIALARGLLAQGKPADAERTLLAARRWGNFPTLEYELASVRLAAGLYREAAEELAQTFTVKDGVIHANLGGRVPRESKFFTELVGYERRASIFAPTAADDPQSAAQLRALLEMKQALDAQEPNADAAGAAVDDFLRPDDKMKVHRELYAASQLLDKKVALPKVLEIAKAAPQALETGLDVPDASTAVLASELYESRRIAAVRGEYVAVPTVPRATLSSVLRGRIEEITGWAYYQMQDTDQAAVHLRRAVSVLPADSSYWRSSLWKLGTAMVVAGKDAEGLDAYLKSYAGGPPDAIRYQAIEAVYKRVNGSTEGLEAKIGPPPASNLIAAVTVPSPTPSAELSVSPSPATGETIAPSPTPATEVPTPLPSPTLESSPPPPTPQAETITPSPTASAEVPSPIPTPTAEPASPSPTPTIELPTPSPIPTPAATPLDRELANAPKIVPIATPAVTEPSPTPSVEIAAPSPTPTLEVSLTASPTATVETASPSPTPVVEAAVTPSASPTPTAETSPPPKEAVAETKASELFPPVVITIPSHDPKTANPPVAKRAPSPTAEAPLPSPTPEAVVASPAPSPTPQIETPTPTPTPTPPTDRPRFVDNEPKPDIPPCKLNLSEENVTLGVGGGDLAVIVGRTDDNELDGLTATSTAPDVVSVRREVIEGMKTRAIFVLHPAGTKTGVYQVVFEMPCGRRELVVRLR